MLSALDEISTKCAAKGVRILVDAESHHFLTGILRVTLDLMRNSIRMATPASTIPTRRT